jgi:GTPase
MEALGSADLVLCVVDATEPPGAGEKHLLDLVARTGTPAVLALNKIDRIRKEKLLPRIEELSGQVTFRDIVPVSARTGENVDRLFDVLAAGLPEGEAAYPDDFLTATPETEWIAEVLREKLLERTRDELPFAHAVRVESVRPAEGKDLTVVIASIIVEREGQKKIVVGKGGSMIRDIGTAARRELEEELGRRFFLELTVRVKPDWRNDEAFLARLRAQPE